MGSLYEISQFLVESSCFILMTSIVQDLVGAMARAVKSQVAKLLDECFSLLSWRRSTTGGRLSRFLQLRLDDGRWSFLDGGGRLADCLQCHRSDCAAASVGLEVMSRFLWRSGSRHNSDIWVLNGRVRDRLDIMLGLVPSRK